MGLNGKTVTIGDQTFPVPRVRFGPYERALTAWLEAKEIETAAKDDADADPGGLKRGNLLIGAILDLLRETNPELTSEQFKAIAPADLVLLDKALAEIIETGRALAGEARSP
jgi:hypothetical protein